MRGEEMKQIVFNSKFDIGDRVKIVSWKNDPKVYKITGISRKIEDSFTIAKELKRDIVMMYHISDKLNNAVGWFTGKEIISLSA